jgi:hypothetical protein
MKSVKCPNCGLVNFSTAVQCKRCNESINELSPIASQRNYQAPTQQLSAYQTPPPPPVFDIEGNASYPKKPEEHICCIKCGGDEKVSVKGFKKDYTPPFCYLGLFIGLLPMAILVSIFRVRHKIEAPFCEICWKRFRMVAVYETLSTLGFFVGVVFGIVAGFATGSIWAFFVVFLATIGVIVWGQIYKKQNSPIYKTINRKQIIIGTPNMGEIIFDR